MKNTFKLRLETTQAEREEIADAVFEMRDTLESVGIRSRDHTDASLILMAINGWLIQERGRGLIP